MRNVMSVLILLAVGCATPVPGPDGDAGILTDDSGTRSELVSEVYLAESCPPEVDVTFDALGGSCAIERFKLRLDLQTGKNPCVGYTYIVEDAPNCEQTFDLTCAGIGQVTGWVGLKSATQVFGVVQVKMSQPELCNDLYEASTTKDKEP